jgi:hypothetical protein
MPYGEAQTSEFQNVESVETHKVVERTAVGVPW